MMLMVVHIEERGEMMLVVVHTEERGDMMLMVVHTEERGDMMTYERSDIMMIVVVYTQLLTSRNE